MMKRKSEGNGLSLRKSAKVWRLTRRIVCLYCKGKQRKNASMGWVQMVVIMIDYNGMLFALEGFD